MGKRELLLVVGFVLVGALVYQFTAPPPDPSARGFSFSRIIDNIRREVRGRPESAEVTQTFTRPAAEGLTEIRVRMPIGGIAVTGEDRTDISVEFHVRSNGFDKAEAEKLAKESTLTFDEAGGVLVIATTNFPDEGTQRPTLRLKVPSRLAFKADAKNGEMTITNVALVAIGVSRAATTITNVKGAVSLTQRGSTATIKDVGSLKLTTAAGARVRVGQVHGDVTLSLQGGEFRGEGFTGALEVESRTTDVQFDTVDGLRGPIRVNANLGKVTFNGLQTDARIDGRETEIRVSMAAPAPLAIYNEGEEPIEVAVPPGGFTVDALSINGKITVAGELEQAGLRVVAPPGGEPADSRRETRLNGSIKGGGPTITLRSQRGDIALRSK
ncbi:MAG: hypothetical protein M3541_17025 [Acidobacteriota bacterium]|nr:hypothetical protein [Acidobacteriota bacterium]MDQ3420448.1 hypothetical protein [Acidobacteriota bacterium]